MVKRAIEIKRKISICVDYKFFYLYNIAASVSKKEWNILVHMGNNLN